MVSFARERYNMGQTNFELFTGLALGSINKIKSGISTTSLAKIASRCPELNLRWLLLGEGEMTGAARPAVSAGGNVTTIGDVSGMTASPVTAYGCVGDGRLPESLLEQNRLLTEQLAAQADTIRRLAGVK